MKLLRTRWGKSSSIKGNPESWNSCWRLVFSWLVFNDPDTACWGGQWLKQFVITAFFHCLSLWFKKWYIYTDQCNKIDGVLSYTDPTQICLMSASDLLQKVLDGPLVPPRLQNIKKTRLFSSTYNWEVSSRFYGHSQLQDDLFSRSYRSLCNFGIANKRYPGRLAWVLTEKEAEDSYKS